MALFPKNPARATKIFWQAYEWRSTYFADTKAVCSQEFLERSLRQENKDYEFCVESNLKNLAGEKIDGCTTFRPHLRITMDEVVYDLASRGDGPSRFSMCHEAAHLILHSEDGRTRNITQLNRGVPYSGTSFKECAELETEANFFAGCFLVPHTAVNAKTTPIEISERFKLSQIAAQKALKVIRVLCPEKWRLK